MKHNKQQDDLDVDQDSLSELQQRIAELEMLLEARTSEVNALRIYEEQFRTVADFTYDWEYWINPDGTLLYVSPSCERITGYRPDEFQNDSGLMESIIHRYDRARMASHFHDEINHPQSCETRYRIITRSGEVRWLGHACQPVYSQDGHWLGHRVSNRNITAQVQAEEAYHLLVENSLEGLFIIQHGHIVFVNPAAERITGYTRDELLTIPPAEIHAIIHPDDWPDLVQYSIDQKAGQDVPSDYEFRIIRKDGTTRWLSAYIVIATYQWNPAMQIVCIDITGRRQAETALSVSEERYRSIFENATIGIFHTTRDGRYLDANPALAQLLGYESPQELMETVTDIAEQLYVEPDYRAKIVRTMEENQGTARLENRYYRKDGSIIEAILNIWTIRDAQGNISSFQGFIEDVTKRKIAETQLEKANVQLIEWVSTLQQHNHEMMLLNQMGSLLESSTGMEEAYKVIGTMTGRLFAGQSGALYIRRDDGPLFEAVAAWGNIPPQETIINIEECHALQQSQSCLVSETTDQRQWCAHMSEQKIISSLCIPLIAQNTILGLLHLRNGPIDDHAACLHWQHVAEMAAGQMAMTLTNLSLLERLQHQALHDGLTGLYNRRYLDETLKRELKQAERTQQSLGIIMLDIDYFKRFNDTCGHDAGDVLLRAVSTFLQASTRSGDIACRYGGEEFTLVLPGASLEDTRQRAEQLRAGIQHITIQHRRQALPAVTISLGVAAFPTHGSTDDIVMKAADQALYQAKAAGRNRVTVAAINSQGEQGE